MKGQVSRSRGKAEVVPSVEAGVRVEKSFERSMPDETNAQDHELENNIDEAGQVSRPRITGGLELHGRGPLVGKRPSWGGGSNKKPLIPCIKRTMNRFQR